jgi:hypothetical protein
MYSKTLDITLAINLFSVITTLQFIVRMRLRIMMKPMKWPLTLRLESQIALWKLQNEAQNHDEANEMATDPQAGISNCSVATSISCVRPSDNRDLFRDCKKAIQLNKETTQVAMFI